MPNPKYGRGGRRSGKPGASYQNRSDLQQGPRTAGQAPAAATGQTYGQAGQQLAAQQAVPLPSPTPLTAPTERPGEHVMAGAAAGPGPGNEALTLPPTTPQLSPEDQLLTTIRGLYNARPNRDLERLLIQLTARNQQAPVI